MSKKASMIISVILFIILVGLIVCERCWPEGGAELLSSITG